LQSFDFAQLVSILLSVAVQLAISHGYGMHKDDLTPQQLHTALRWFFIAQSPYKVVVCLNKVSVILFFLRLFTGRRFRVACWICMAVVVAWSIGTIAATILQCVPIAGSWDKSIHAVCINSDAFWLAYAILNVLTDALVLTLPLPQIIGLHLKLREKIMLFGVFLIGGFVVFAGIMRTTAVSNSFANKSDITWDFIPRGIWTLIEANLGIICACLPILKGPFTNALSSVSRRTASLKPSRIRRDASSTLKLQSAIGKGWNRDGDDAKLVGRNSVRVHRDSDAPLMATDDASGKAYAELRENLQHPQAIHVSKTFAVEVVGQAM
jgi:hypothetical protein